MLGKELHHAESRLSLIRLLPEAMPFIGEQHVLYRHAALPERSHNLLCFDNGYVGVVGTMLHHNRGLNAIEFVDRRERSQRCFVKKRIAILDLGYCGHPRLGMRKESLKVYDPIKIDGGSK